jgi:hypothetical protein
LRHIWTRTLALAVVLASMAPLAAHAGAQPHMIFGSVGINRSQTARLNIANIGNPDLRLGSCTVDFGFVGGDNQLLLPAVRVVLEGSSSTHLDVGIGNPDFVGNPNLRRGQRLDVRPFVGLVPDVAGACDSFVGNIEIIDSATGATAAIVNPLVYVGFNPQPDIPGLVGIGTSGQ